MLHVRNFSFGIKLGGSVCLVKRTVLVVLLLMFVLAALMAIIFRPVILASAAKLGMFKKGRGVSAVPEFLKIGAVSAQTKKSAKSAHGAMSCRET